MAAVIKVSGLREFQVAVRKAADAKPRLMRDGLNDVAEIIVHDVVPLMESSFVTDPARRTGALERSVRASSTSRAGRVTAGYPSRVPYAGWWEFGGSTKRKAGGMYREWVKRGRTLYPTVDRRRVEIVAEMERVLNRIADIINLG